MVMLLGVVGVVLPIVIAVAVQYGYAIVRALLMPNPCIPYDYPEGGGEEE